MPLPSTSNVPSPVVPRATAAAPPAAAEEPPFPELLAEAPFVGALNAATDAGATDTGAAVAAPVAADPEHAATASAKTSRTPAALVTRIGCLWDGSNAGAR